MRPFFLILNMTLIGWLLAGNMLHAQIIKGRITDVNGQPVSNASLFIRELKLGTAANEQGYYELKVAEGVYTCVFQCLGYETETHVITVAAGVVEEDERVELIGGGSSFQCRRREFDMRS